METLRSGPVHTSSGWVCEQRYIQVLSALGGVPSIIPLLEGDEDTLRAIYARLDGVLLTGGASSRGRRGRGRARGRGMASASASITKRPCRAP